MEREGRQYTYRRKKNYWTGQLVIILTSYIYGKIYICNYISTDTEDMSRHRHWEVVQRTDGNNKKENKCIPPDTAGQETPILGTQLFPLQITCRNHVLSSVFEISSIHMPISQSCWSQWNYSHVISERPGAYLFYSMLMTSSIVTTYQVLLQLYCSLDK